MKDGEEVIYRMLQAKSSGGELITLATLTPAELKQLKLEKQTFTCPACGSRVIAKAGTKLIPHFAHHQADSCITSANGESDYHEQGKLLLYQWLKAQQLQVKLEAYLPEIQQRPDILLTVNKKTIAIEYQCARIPPEVIIKRNNGYKRAGITPIWIMGEQLLKRKSTNGFKLDSFLQLFIHQFTSATPPIIYFFCPHTTQLINLMDIYSVGNGLAFGFIQIRTLQAIQFPELFHFHNFERQTLWRIWKKEKARFRIRPIKQFGAELKWHKWLYEKGLHRDFLPTIVHIPVPSQHFMKQPLWRWQSKLVIEVLSPLPLGGTISLNRLNAVLRQVQHPQRIFPLIKHFTNPVTEYMQLLCQLGYFRETTPNQYQKLIPISFFSSVEDAIKADNELTIQFLRKVW